MISDQTLVLIAIILMLVDIFLPTDITTFIAYIIFSYLIAHNIDVPVLYQVIIGILAWWAMVALHYYLFRKSIRWFTERYISPTRIKSGMAAYPGKAGQIKKVDEELFLIIGDELYPFIEKDGKQCKPGDTATIIEYSDEKMIIQLTNKTAICH